MRFAAYYGDGKNTQRRFCRWWDSGVGERLLEILICEPDFEWLMIDASHINVHLLAAGERAVIRIGDAQKELNAKILLAVNAYGMPVRMLITAGPVADCSQTHRIIEGIDAEHLLAGKGYDSNALVDSVKEARINSVITPRKSRKNLRSYDKYLYRPRHLVENVFLELKRWQGVATQYAKNTAPFLAAVHIRCIAIWAKIKLRQYLARAVGWFYFYMCETFCTLSAHVLRELSL